MQILLNALCAKMMILYLKWGKENLPSVPQERPRIPRTMDQRWRNSSSHKIDYIDLHTAVFIMVHRLNFLKLAFHCYWIGNANLSLSLFTVSYAHWLNGCMRRAQQQMIFLVMVFPKGNSCQKVHGQISRLTPHDPVLLLFHMEQNINYYLHYTDKKKVFSWISELK